MWQLTEAERAVRDRAAAVARDIQPKVLALADGDPYPQDIHDAIAAAGITGLTFPVSFGGQGAGLLAACVASEELARVSLTASMIATAPALVCRPLLHAGSPAQRERWLPGVARGDLRGAFALTEPTAGSDAAALTTRAWRDGDGWVLDGAKRFIGNAAGADVLVVFARTGGPGALGISAFLVPGDVLGLLVEPLATMGLPGWDLGGIRFERVELPAGALLGGEGDGFKIAMATLDHTRPTVAAQSVGLAQGAVDLAVEYALRRHTFGQPLLDHQAVALRLAELEAEVAAARALTYQAAALAGSPDGTRSAAMSKLIASETAVRAASEAVQVLGGNGYLRDYPAERILRDARVLTIFEGASNIQKLVISRHQRRRVTDGHTTWPTITPSS